jgi:hypothetical protein
MIILEFVLSKEGRGEFKPGGIDSSPQNESSPKLLTVPEGVDSRYSPGTYH